MVDIVVANVDTGIDDAYGLILLVNADNLGLITLAAIICTLGNTILLNSCRNTIRLLEVLNRSDIPVYQGVNKPLIVDPSFDDYFGKDGFGDASNLPEPNMGLLKTDNAAQMLYLLTNAYPERVTLIDLGPLTHTAITVIQYGSLPLKSIWIMGGNSTASEEPEFNWRNDPEAAYGVLTRLDVPKYILTFDACTELTTNIEWRKNTLGKISNNLTDFMNVAEAYKFNSSADDASWTMCDAIAVAALLHTEEINTIQTEFCGSVTLSQGCNGSTKGGFLLLESTCPDKNLVVVRHVNSEDYENILYKAVANFS